MTRSSARRGPRTLAGFTLVEALVSISLAASVLLLAVDSSLQTTDDALQQTVATGMAQQLLDEIAGTAHFDAVAAYDGVRSQPPLDPWKVELGTDDGQGGQRHPDFWASRGFLDRWRQEIDVWYVSESNLSTPLSPTATSGYRLVEVRITYDDAQRGRRVLARLRRILANVDPLD